MTDNIILSGSGGGKSGGSAGAVEDANTLRSKSIGYAKDLWSMGEIYGFDEPGAPLYYVYLNGVPIQNKSDRTFNYQGFNFAYRTGIPTQTAMGSAGTETPLNIPGGVVLGGSSPGGDGHPPMPWTGAITEVETDAIRMIVSVPTLTQADVKTGDLHGSSVDVIIDVLQTTGPLAGQWVRVLQDWISGKCVSAYERSYRVDLPKPGPWQIRVSRSTLDALDSSTQNQLGVKSLFQILDENFTYPNMAYAGITMDSEYFNGQIPKRQYLLRGLKILIPSNYDPFARIYSGVWDGTFVTNWTNNPAWIYYDLLVSPLRGLGNDIEATQIDKWALYQIAQYSDGWNARPAGTTNDFSTTGIHGVPDGTGLFEPRFTFNGIINTQKEAYQVLQALAASFRGITYWGSGSISAVQDCPKDAVQILSPANVLDGTFNYASSRLADRHTSCTVGYTNPNDFYQPDYVVAENLEAMQIYGYRDVAITAIGCTSVSQAYRLGKWLVQTEWDETETVTYSCGMDQLRCRPGDIIKIADPAIAGSRYGGRIAESNADSIGPIGQNLISTPYFPTLSVGNWIGRAQQGVAVTLRTGERLTGRDGVEVGWRDPTDLTTDSLENISVVPTTGVPWRYALQVGCPLTFCNFATGSNSSVTPGQTIYMSCWMQTLGFAYGGYFNVTFLNSAGASVGTANVCGLGPAGGWVCVSGSTVVPAYATTMTLGIVSSAPAGAVASFLVSHLWCGTVPAYVNNGVGNTITLDAPVTLEGNDTITIVKADGTLMTGAINFAYGSQTTLILSSALAEYQRMGAMWAIEGGVTKNSTWRVMRIKESKLHQFEVTATQYDPTKYARIEFDIRLPKASISRLSTGTVNAPSNFNSVESLYRANNQVRSRLTMSWVAAKDSAGNVDSRITGYHVEWLPPGATAWATLADVTTASYDMPDVQPGVYGFRISTQTPFGRSIVTLESDTVSVVGANTPPVDVTGFTATPQLAGIQLDWNTITSIDFITYEIREGGSWDTGTVLSAGIAGTTIFIPITDIDTHTYFIKAIGASGIGSISVATNYSNNAATVTSQLTGPSNVTVFSCQPQGSNILFTWVPVAGNDIQYEIRVGNNWVFGQTVWAGTGASATIVYPGTGMVIFWIKSVSKAGLYCKTAFFSECTLSSLQLNYVLQADAGALSWSGTKGNTVFDSATNSLAVQNNKFTNGKALASGGWGVNGFVTNNSAAAIDGTITATKFIEPIGSAGTGIGIGQSQYVITGLTYEFSFGVKVLGSGSKRWVALLLPATQFGGFLSVMVDTMTGTVVSSSSGITNVAVVNGGNSWWRITASAVAIANGSAGIGVRVSSTATDQFANNAGDGVSGVYFDDFHMRITGQLVYGEFFENIDLGATIRARNWLDTDFLLLDASTLTWAGAGFAWSSDTAATTSWIASGDDTGANLLPVIATKQLSPPSDMIDALGFNSTLLSYTGAATLASSSATSYTQHMVYNGLSMTSAGYAKYNFPIPATFATRFTVQLFSPAISETLIMLKGSATTPYISVLRNADRSFTLHCSDGDMVLPTLTFAVDDFITFIIVQNLTQRIFSAYSQRSGDYQTIVATKTPLGAFTQVNFAGSAAAFPSVYANVEFFTTSYATTILETFAAGGKTPVGYNDFTPFVVGDYQYRYAILGFLLNAPAGVGRPAVDKFVLHVDVPNLNETGTATATAGGWTTVQLTKPWVKPPFVQGYQTSGTVLTTMDVQNATAANLPTIPASFQFRLRQSDGTIIAGNVAYQCSGY